MKIWIDAQLSPLIASWIKKKFNIESTPVRDLGLRDATDKEIYSRAKVEDVIIVTKDIDFKILQDKIGPPPKIIWLTCGNTYNERLKEILDKNLQKSLNLLASGERIVEISD
jgi:predicted nuclease of predicted toxin-antitoxin system